ncbi:ArdC family protein [Pseudonocardia sp. CA-107938]|uniref:ArdC family protein n=1 Tax=Pseudonocardia sp. CA-107938 TaxID=3240021 RepID=UPI003D939F6D
MVERETRRGRHHMARKTRRTYNDAEREERAAADRQLAEQAAELLDDPDAVAEMVGHFLVGRSALLRYSLRNLALLFIQGDERGIDVTDVATFRGWRDRGRCVTRGARALRIVAPKGSNKAAESGDGDGPTRSTGAEDATRPAPDGDATSEGKPGRPRFALISVFDISQTGEVIADDNTDGPAAGETATGAEGPEVGAGNALDPDAVPQRAFAEHVARYGYTVDIDPDAESVDLDDATHTVTIPEDVEPLDLARVLAELLARPRPDRDADDSQDGARTDDTGDAARATTPAGRRRAHRNTSTAAQR